MKTILRRFVAGLALLLVLACGLLLPAQPPGSPTVAVPQTANVTPFGTAIGPGKTPNQPRATASPPTPAPAAAASPTAAPTRTRGAPRPNSVDNGNIFLQFSANQNDGLAITHICDEAANVDYISLDCNASNPTSLFDFAVDAGGSTKSYQSDTGLAGSEVRQNADGTLSITAAAKDVPLSFTIDVSAPAGEPAALIRIKAKNTGRNQFYLRMVLPKLNALQNISSPDMWGAIPQEVGSVAPLNDSQSFAISPKFGMQLDPNANLPRGINSMDVATIYNRKHGGGIFFASIDNPAFGGVAPIQFIMDSSAIAGYWYAPIEAQQEVDLPGLAIGVCPHGDWHTAVDYYVAKNRPNWSFPQIPAWFRDEGAIYSISGGGAGGIYLSLPA